MTVKRKQISRGKYLRTGPGNQVDKKMARNLDDLRDFEDYKEIFGFVRADVKAGYTVEELRAKYAPLAQARLITTALSEPDTSKANAAIKDMLDRKDGRAKESLVHTHRYEDIPEEEVDSLLLSRLNELNQDGQTKKTSKSRSKKH